MSLAHLQKRASHFWNAEGLFAESVSLAASRDITCTDLPRNAPRAKVSGPKTSPLRCSTAESVSLAASRGTPRPSLPRGMPRAKVSGPKTSPSVLSAAKSVTLEVSRGILRPEQSRDRPRATDTGPKTSPSRLSAAESVTLEVPRDIPYKSEQSHCPISAILLANRNPPTNGSISPCHRNCASATDRTPGR